MTQQHRSGAPGLGLFTSQLGRSLWGRKEAFGSGLTPRLEEVASHNRERRSRILIAEHPPEARERLVHALQEEQDLQVCGYADDADAVWRDLSNLRPDLVLLDLRLPPKGALALIRQIRGEGSKVKILIFSHRAEAIDADRVLRAGADGYVMKSQDSAEITHAIRDVLAGRLYVSESVMSWGAEISRPSVIASNGGWLQSLAPVPRGILALLGQGRSDREIASRFQLTAAQLAAYYRRMQRALDLDSFNGLVRHAVCLVNAT